MDPQLIVRSSFHSAKFARVNKQLLLRTFVEDYRLAVALCMNKLSMLIKPHFINMYRN